MKNPPVPDIRDLSAREAEALLRRNRIGRLAYTYRNKVDIRPLHYAWRRGWLFGRTSPGDKLMKLTYNQWVAFEIDEIDNGVAADGTTATAAPLDQAFGTTPATASPATRAAPCPAGTVGCPSSRRADPRPLGRPGAP